MGFIQYILIWLLFYSQLLKRSGLLLSVLHMYVRVHIEHIGHHHLLLPGAELPLMVESFGPLNDLFPFPSILDAGYPIFEPHLANVLFDAGYERTN